MSLGLEVGVRVRVWSGLGLGSGLRVRIAAQSGLPCEPRRIQRVVLKAVGNESTRHGRSGLTRTGHGLDEATWHALPSCQAQAPAALL